MDIVYIAAGTWESILQRTQALAIELSRDNRVLYVNSVLQSVPGAFKRVLSREACPFPGIREPRKNLAVVDLVPGLPGACHSGPVNHFNVRWAAVQIKRWLAKLAFGEYVLWIATPWAARLCDYLDPGLLCYDCMDNVPAFFQGSQRLLIQNLEQNLVRRADAVFASSAELYESCRGVTSKVHLVRNGVWTDGYEAAEPTPELGHLPRPIIGYVGFFGPWIDQDALATLAERFSSGSLVIVGPVHVDITRLQRYRNVHFLGRKPHTEVPNYIQAFDVALIPFLLDELATAVNPVKFYEYCAAGKPIVASALPELAPYADLCYLAESSSGFVAQSEQAWAEVTNSDMNSALVRQRRAVAKENSWQMRANSVCDVLARSLPTEPPHLASPLAII